MNEDCPAAFFSSEQVAHIVLIGSPIDGFECIAKARTTLLLEETLQKTRPKREVSRATLLHCLLGEYGTTPIQTAACPTAADEGIEIVSFLYSNLETRLLGNTGAHLEDFTTCGTGNAAYVQYLCGLNQRKKQTLRFVVIGITSRENAQHFVRYATQQAKKVSAYMQTLLPQEYQRNVKNDMYIIPLISISLIDEKRMFDKTLPKGIANGIQRIHYHP